MGPVSLAESLVLDTNCLIYYLDQPDTRRGRWLDQHVFRPAVAGRLDLAIPTLALAELMVRPYGDGQPRRAEALRRALETLPGLTLVPLTADIAALAADARARSGLRLPDAIVAATARHRGASLLTNDRQVAAAELPGARLLLDDSISSS